MNFRNILRLFKPNANLSPSNLDAIPSDTDWDEVREKNQEEARKAALPSHVVCKAIDLKSGDTIIHNYSVFKITECGCGFGAGNEFGDYFYIEGRYVNGNPTDPEPLKKCWAFQKCPVIKLTSSIESTNSPT